MIKKLTGIFILLTFFLLKIGVINVQYLNFFSSDYSLEITINDFSSFDLEDDECPKFGEYETEYFLDEIPLNFKSYFLKRDLSLAEKSDLFLAHLALPEPPPNFLA